MTPAQEAKVAEVTARLTGDPIHAYMVPAPRPWYARFFEPQRLPAVDGSVFHVTSVVDTTFTWKERLLILCTGRVVTEVRVRTAAPVTVVATEATAYPTWMKS